MRLDKFLKISRIIKRRTVANEVSDSGRILVNNIPAKPAKQVKEGDIISIIYANKTINVEILRVPLTNSVPVQEAASLYRVLEK